MAATLFPSLELDLSHLHKAIHCLQKRSTKLDAEKQEAESQLRRAVRNLKKRHRLGRKVRKILCRLKKIFGHKCKRKCHHPHPHPNKKPPTIIREKVTPRIGRYPAWRKEQQEVEEFASAYGFILEAGLGDDLSSLDLHSESQESRFCQLRHAVKRVQTVNKKLIAFERGFISDDGIKDR